MRRGACFILDLTCSAIPALTHRFSALYADGPASPVPVRIAKASGPRSCVAQSPLAVPHTTTNYCALLCDIAQRSFSCPSCPHVGLTRKKKIKKIKKARANSPRNLLRGSIVLCLAKCRRRERTSLPYDAANTHMSDSCIHVLVISFAVKLSLFFCGIGCSNLALSPLPDGTTPQLSSPHPPILPSPSSPNRHGRNPSLPPDTPCPRKTEHPKTLCHPVMGFPVKWSPLCPKFPWAKIIITTTHPS